MPYFCNCLKTQAVPGMHRVKAIVEATMKGYNLAVQPPRIALMA